MYLRQAKKNGQLPRVHVNPNTEAMAMFKGANAIDNMVQFNTPGEYANPVETAKHTYPEPRVRAKNTAVHNNKYIQGVMLSGNLPPGMDTKAHALSMNYVNGKSLKAQADRAFANINTWGEDMMVMGMIMIGLLTVLVIQGE
jgi:enamine deaminase RidA (YjgF/YER057c/UK114 family)